MKSALDILIEELKVGACTRTEISSRKAQPVESDHNVAAGLSGPLTSELQQSQEGKPGDCGSAHCAGCYNVDDGKKIHPPKIGEDYRRWLERWKPIGAPQ